jgi:hypothetical protein
LKKFVQDEEIHPGNEKNNRNILDWSKNKNMSFNTVSTN